MNTTACSRHAAALCGTLLLALAGPVLANDAVPPAPQRQPLLITGATLHTVSGPVLVNGRMLIERGRITALAGPGEALPQPAGGPPVVIDLGGRHVYPGFVSANSAIGLAEVSAVQETLDVVETGLINPNARALVAINADSELLPVARSNGVLAALVVPGTRDGGGIAGTSALVQLDGWTWEDMALEPALALHVALPTMRLNAVLFNEQPDVLREGVRKLVAERLKAIDEAFHHAAAYAAARAADPTTPFDARWEAMRPVFDGRRPVFVHAHELAQIRHALALAQRHRLALTIVGGDDAWRIADVLRARNVGVVIAGMHRLPTRRDDDVDGPFSLAARLAKAGVRFCIARSNSAGAATSERNLPYEAATAAAHGLPRDEALKAITLYPAQMLGMDQHLGALAPGRLASFIVTDGDPLETRTRIERVFVQGREVDASNRQTRLEAKYRQRYEQLALPPVGR